VLKTVYRSSCCDKDNCQRRDSNLGPLTPQSDALITPLLRPAIHTDRRINGVPYVGSPRDKNVNRARCKWAKLILASARE